MFVIGNGGSSSIAEHFVCDLINLNRSRINVKAIALTSNSSVLTALSNDNGFEHIFLNQLASLAESGDLVFVITSSGNSENLIKALDINKIKKLRFVSLTGFDGGKIKKLVNQNIHINSNNYGIIETSHMLICHQISYEIGVEFTS